MTAPIEYHLEIWDRTFSNILTKIKAFGSMNYEISIDKGNTAEVVIPYTRPELTRENIEVMNRVRIKHGEDTKWEGYLNLWSMQSTDVTIRCLGLEGILEKRLITKEYSEQAANEIFQDIFDVINDEDDTGITAGTFEFGGVGVPTVPDESTDTFTSEGHGFLGNEQIVIVSTESVPFPLVEHQIYFVVNETTDTFQLSLTSGGSVINIQDNGTGDISFIRAQRGFDFQDQTALSALRTVAQSVGSEFFIDFGGVAKMVVARGSDKSNGEVTFKLLDNKPNETNVEDINVVYDGSELFNSIKGTTTSLTSTKTTQDSIDTFGLLERVESIGDANDQSTLDQETEIILEKLDSPIEIPELVPIEERISSNLYEVGDIVGVKIDRGFYSLNLPFRVTSKMSEVRQDKQVENVRISLSDRAVTRKDVLNTIAETVRRVYSLERA